MRDGKKQVSNEHFLRLVDPYVAGLLFFLVAVDFAMVVRPAHSAENP